jgi:hypothetical protein
MENFGITFGLIVFGIILLAIISAFIFSPSFRKDVIASEGEAAVLGVINVKGVIIVLLMGIFGAFFFAIIRNDAGSGQTGQDMTTADALKHLQSNTKAFEIKEKRKGIYITHDTVDYMIGDLPPVDYSEDKLIANKDTNDLNKWNLSLSGSNLGAVRLNLEQARIIFDSSAVKNYKFGEPYKIGELDLHFKIESVYEGPPNSGQYTYDIRFGEAQSPRDIIWYESTVTYPKSLNGKIILNNGLNSLEHPQWKNEYYVGLGIGIPLQDDEKKYISVDCLNIIAVKAKVE